VLRFDLLDTSNNPLNHSSIILQNGESALDSKLIVTSGTPFTYSIRIKASTARLNTYVTLQIRICGNEVISTHSSVKKSYIFGFVEGDPASLSDSQRYFTIPQSEFKNWFYINLGASDYCAQYGFALLDA
jgi:hypothetical protein